MGSDPALSFRRNGLERSEVEDLRSGLEFVLRVEDTKRRNCMEMGVGI